jgi:hypothetical protein
MVCDDRQPRTRAQLGRYGTDVAKRPLRFDYAFPLTKETYDRVQQFRFGGGTKF